MPKVTKKNLTINAIKRIKKRFKPRKRKSIITTSQITNVIISPKKIGLPSIEYSNISKVPLKNSQFYTNLIHHCVQNYTMKEFIGRGQNGSVFKVCKDEDCQYAIKIIKLRYLPNSSDEEEMKEREISNEYNKKMRELGVLDDFDIQVRNNLRASELGIAPKFYGSFRCFNGNYEYGFIVSELLDITAQEYLEELYKLKYQGKLSEKDIDFVLDWINQEMQLQLKIILKVYPNSTFSDVDRKNIMFKMSNGIPLRMFIIDWEKSNITV